MVLVKKWDFLHLFVFAIISKKKVFGDILERKNAFLDYKNKKQNKSKNSNTKSKSMEKLPFFQSGMSMVLVTNEIFSTFFIFGRTGKKRVFGVIIERKTPF